jgi:hypothetical protein
MPRHYTLYSLLFLFFNALIPIIVLIRSQRKPSSPPPDLSPKPPASNGTTLEAEFIFEWEFEYARATASEAMEDRHKMVNFYLLIGGATASGVLASLGKEFSLAGVGTLLLWTFSILGWFYFLSIVRLREAWYDSVRAMLAIKEFCIANVTDFPAAEFAPAFRWREATLPSPEKAWSLYHFAALLIGFFNSLAFILGGHLLGLEFQARNVSLNSTLFLFLLGVVLFWFHVGLYSAFLKKKA